MDADTFSPGRRDLHQLEAHVSRVLRDSGVGRGASVIAAVSGGPDSSALLLLLCQAADRMGFTCEAAYFDHEIRSPAEREAELDCVQRLVTAAGVVLHTGGAPVRRLAKQARHGIEEEARLQRYRFLAEVATQRGAAFVATGHTADDQVETLLLHLIRGTGLLGLAGIQELSSWPFGPGPALLRPILGLTRANAGAYVRSRGLIPHVDSENGSPRYLRNRVRNELLPLLESFNPRIRDSLLRLSRAASQHNDLVEELLAREPEDVAGTPPSPGFAVAALRRFPTALRVERLARGYAAAAGSRSGLTQRHLAALETLIGAEGEGRVDLPAGLQARVSGGRLVIEPSRRAGTRRPPVPGAAPIPVPGRVRFGGWEFIARSVPPGEVCLPSPLQAVLPHSIDLKLTLRTRLPGDRMRLGTGKGHTKLQDVMVNAKLPRPEREAYPLVCLGHEVVWVPGIRSDDRARTVDLSLRRVCLRAARLDAKRTSGLGSGGQTE